MVGHCELLTHDGANLSGVTVAMDNMTKNCSLQPHQHAAAFLSYSSVVMCFRHILEELGFP